MRARELLIGFVVGLLLAPLLFSALGRRSGSESSSTLLPSLVGPLQPLEGNAVPGEAANAPLIVEVGSNPAVTLRPLPTALPESLPGGRRGNRRRRRSELTTAATVAVSSVDPASPAGSAAAGGSASARPGRRFHLTTSVWQPTPAEAPWYYPNAGGSSNRARSQLAMRKSSGYLARDSALPPARGSGTPVLSGTSWHWPLPTAAQGVGEAGTSLPPQARTAPCGGGCGGHGVCVPHLGRCDCGPYTWGADCSIPVVCTNPQCICVHNDSSPWFCDAPACKHDADEMVSPAPGAPSRRCVGRPLDKCPHSCHGHGRCLASAFGSSCACFEGFGGPDCGRPVASTRCLTNCSGHGECLKGWCKCKPPYWGTDCARGGPRRADGKPSGPRCTKSPCFYVYELPPRMNVLALKAEFDWRQQVPGKKFDYRTPPMLHEALLGSGHRTIDPSEADLFYVPTWDWHGSWGNAEVYYRAHRYISSFYPYWNASGGADHVWAIARDAAACDTPWGSLREELRTSIILSNWGGVTGLSGRIQERCFRPSWDVVVPGTLTDSVVRLSPFWLGEAEQTAQHATRTTQLFFSGALCWKTSTIARTARELQRKCERSYSEPGFLSRYSFGLRYEIFTRFRQVAGFRLHASDFPPSLPPRRERRSLDAEILTSKFCLCPSGTGWGMRVYHVMVLGCVPVLTQHDGEHPPVAQAFEPELLDWSSFAVVVRRDEIARLPQILEATDIDAKRAELRRVWHRIIWRGGLDEPRRSKLPMPDAFESTMGALRVRLQQAATRGVSGGGRPMVG